MKTECGCESPKKGYRHTLTVKSLNNTSAVHVDQTDESNWTSQGTIKANFVTRSGREFFNANQVQADHDSLIETPWNNWAATNVLPERRLYLNSRKFEILSVVDKNEESRKILITVKEQK